MVWDSFESFFHMGGYALYVWGSVATCFSLMTFEVLSVRRRNKQAKINLGLAEQGGMSSVADHDVVTWRRSDES